MPQSDLQFIELEKIKLPLVNQFYKRVYKKGVANKTDACFALQGKEIICAAKLKMLDEHKLLTAVACDPIHRGQGYGSQLVAQILRLQQQPIYCFLSPYLRSFYIRLGFSECDMQTVPEIIKQKFNLYSKNRSLLLMHYSMTHLSENYTPSI